jgi:hypothetical protein
LIVQHYGASPAAAPGYRNTQDADDRHRGVNAEVFAAGAGVKLER